ncbi:homoserine dehydrogenase [Lyngbya confervoides]|uniref:Homoserine dehydrogenase n=1 Tax=Lyngbya confervoides BDU141951 TaxID=1574623 RepID=A0ABD4T979_9CYAN|nr:homoserine dehydrogenase [Lyngbya confervoides]MCM1985352.1 homoserine dehydrogenase [Lyngbya confervoides BDU141951]
MGFKVGLLGLGTVGTGIVQILQTPQGRHPILQRLELAAVGVRSLEKPRSVALDSGLLTTDLAAIVTHPEIDIVVEVIGGLEPARSLILKAIEHGKHVVTANKAVIARYGDEIFTAANDAGVYVMLEAAVAGGIPVIQPMKQSLGGNQIRSVTGILNGTTNYILTQMQESGGDFNAILAEAQRLGYAEADPTADIDGLDAGDKIAILASLAFGGRIKLDQVHREGIRHITAADITYADKLGFVIKLLAIAKATVDPSAGGVSPMEDPQMLDVRVHPTLVPKEHPLASVNDVFNAILIEADPLGQVMFFGPGAGAGPTASAVVADVINVAALIHAHPDADTQGYMHPLLACSHKHYSEIAPIAGIKTRFFTRLITHDHPGVIGSIGTAFGEHHVSLESIVQTDTQQDRAEIVVVTHHVQEGQFRQALDQIDRLAAVNCIDSVLRVL